MEARLDTRESETDAGKRARDEVAGKEQAARSGRAQRDDGLRPDERSLASELAATKARKDARDVLLDEAVNILGDAVAALKTGAGLAARVKGGSPLPSD